jgi:hypothetical protein
MTDPQGIGRGQPGTRRSSNNMEPLAISVPADIMLELDRMVEIGAAKSKADAARLLMRKGMET